MHPDASLRPNAHALFSQILANMLKGVHPPSPTKRPSSLEHITRTRYSSLFKPAIAKAWKEQNQGNVGSDFQTYRAGPSPSFCKKVLQNLLDAFSEDDWKCINQEVDDEWDSAKESYRQEIMELYGEHASEGLARALPNVLQPLMSTLESLTGMSFILWAGGPLNRGIGLINVTSDFKEIDAPLIIPVTQNDLFADMAHQWMGKNQDDFLDRCIETSEAITIKLPQKFLRSSSPINDLNASQEQLEINRTTCTAMPRDSPSSMVRPVASLTPRLRSPAAPDLMHPTTSNNTRPLYLNGGVHVASASQKRKGSLEGLLHAQSPPMKKQRISTAVSSSTSSLSSGGHLQGRSTDPQQDSRRSLTNSTTAHSEISAARENVNIPPPGPQCCSPPQTQAPTAPGPLPTVYVKHKHDSSLASIPTSIDTIIQSIPASSQWLTEVLSSLVGVDIGPQYNHLIKLLVELEMMHNFNGKNGLRLAKTSRPAEVGKWINTGRRSRSSVVKIADISKYATSWWHWWKSLQPKWRKYDNEGMPIGVVPQGEVEDWSGLLVPGVNGLVSVVASLYWWGYTVTMVKGKTKGDGRGWDEAVADCGWVLEQLISTMKQQKAQEIEANSR